jgi:DNA-binding transcriptional ArsR family regulator
MSHEGSDSPAKDALFASFARVGRALANGHRVEIVDVLAQGERSVEAIAREIGQSIANTSQHLRVLAGAGLTQSRREGSRVIYRLAGEDVAELWQTLREVAARHLLEVEVLAAAYLGDRADIERVTAEELEARLAEGSVVVLDVRPGVEFDAGHIAGAASAPLHRLLDGNVEVSFEMPVIAYCRGPYCVYADDAVRFLRARGVDASRLDVGYPEWLRAGRPVAAR